MGNERRTERALAFMVIGSLCILAAAGQTMVISESAPEPGTRAGTGVVNMFWIGVNGTAHPDVSLLDTVIEPGNKITLSFAGNHSGGWAEAVVEIHAWYDRGETGNGSAYPDEADRNRNSAFSIVYHPMNQTAFVAYPDGNLEIEITHVQDKVSQANPSDAAQSIHEVMIDVRLGAQLVLAKGAGFAAADPDYSPEAYRSLQDPWSWDLNMTIMDKNNPAIASSVYGEFGMESLVSISVSGHPSATAEPGDYVKMDAGSIITYNSNGIYWVNVTIQDLHLDGDALSPEFIPAQNISVMNVHPMAGSANSEIAEEPVNFAGPDASLSVWGLESAGMPPAGNGTCTAGPWATDYNSDNCSTVLEWWVSIPKGTELGTYWAVIVVTIESGQDRIIIGPTKTNGVKVVDITPPVSSVVEADSQSVTATAYDDETKVENVTLWYRFSEDNEAWGDWTELGTDFDAPWQWNDTAPEGKGYYEFYTTARDSGDNLEDAPAVADAVVEPNSGIPGFELGTFALALAICLAVFALRRR